MSEIIAKIYHEVRNVESTVRLIFRAFRVGVAKVSVTVEIARENSFAVAANMQTA